jgi:hypothetical protein
MGDVERLDPPPARPAAPLEYKPDPPGGRVSVRGFRVLLALTLVNTTLLGASVMGPQLFPFLAQRWTQWRADRAAMRAKAQAAQAALALRQQALTHSVPAGTVVYDEDPVEAERLIRTGGNGLARVSTAAANAPGGWLPPVMLVTPRFYADFQASVFGPVEPGWSDPLLFLHERTAPGGMRHVVSVQLHPGVRFNASATYTDASKTFHIVHRQSKQRMLTVTAWPVGTAAAPAPPGDLPARHIRRTYHLHLPDTAERQVAERVVRSRSANEPGPVDYGNVVRFYGGQIDVDDPSHFTLPYRIDGREEAIDGWIREGAIELRPRSGRWFFDGGDVLRLDAPPATRPTIYPAPPGAG